VLLRMSRLPEVGAVQVGAVLGVGVGVLRMCVCSYVLMY